MAAAEEMDAQWRLRVAEAARRAAADIDPDEQPSLRALHADLVELAERLEAEAVSSRP